MDILIKNLELYHSCRQDGGVDAVKMKSPFLSEDNTRQWLTRGYYFWVADIELARSWGKYSVNGDYAIVKVDVQYEDKEVLDLISSPLQINAFRTMLSKFMEIMKRKHSGKYDPTVSECVNYYRTLGTFPFKGILAAEEQHKSTTRRKFIGKAENVIALNNRQQFCLFEGAEDIIVNKCIVQPDEWAA